MSTHTARMSWRDDEEAGDAAVTVEHTDRAEVALHIEVEGESQLTLYFDAITAAFLAADLRERAEESVKDA